MTHYYDPPWILGSFIETIDLARTVVPETLTNPFDPSGILIFAEVSSLLPVRFEIYDHFPFKL